METAGSSETSVSVYHTTRDHISEGSVIDVYDGNGLYF
jgi:hypothetical protein